MTAITGLPFNARIDAVLDRLQQDRDRVLAAESGPERSTWVAELYEREARWWAVLFEYSNTRVHWLAALCAREHARRMARVWRGRAAVQRSHQSMPQPAEAQAAV